MNFNDCDVEKDSDCDEFMSASDLEDAEDDVEPENAEEEVIPPDYQDLQQWKFDAPENPVEDTPLSHEPGFKPGVFPEAPTQGKGLYHAAEYYVLFWPLLWYTWLATRTNDYAAAQLNAGAKTSTTWVDTTAAELMAFHGVLIYMSIKKFEGGIRQYWSKGPFGDPWVQGIFTFSRFKDLLRFFHVSDVRDYSEADKEDKTRKLKKWFVLGNQRIRDIWNALKKICFDETMTKVLSSCPIGQNMPNKPIPKGSKTFSGTDGAGIPVYQQLYGGSNGSRHKNLTADVIKDCIYYINSTGHLFTMDNYYGNFPVYDTITHSGNHCILMVKRPRKVAADSPVWERSIAHLLNRIVSKKESVRGAHCTVYHRNGCKFTIWRDNEIVILMTDVVPDDVTTCKRWSKELRQVLEIECPLVVYMYNHNKSETDIYNCKKAEADIITTFRKWWKRIFFNGPWHRMECAAWRAAVWHNRRPDAQTLCHREFRQELCLWLVEGYVAAKVHVDRPCAAIVAHGVIPPQPNFPHVLYHLNIPAGQHSKNRCSVCRSISREVVWGCLACGVAVHKKCFCKLHPI